MNKKNLCCFSPATLIFAILLLFAQATSAASVTLDVNWPAYANENTVSIETTGGTTVAGPYNSGSASNYVGTFGPVTLTDGDTYVVRMIDSAADGWDGGGTVTVNVGSTAVKTGNASVSNDTFTFIASPIDQTPPPTLCSSTTTAPIGSVTLDFSDTGVDWPNNTYSPQTFNNIDGDTVDMTISISDSSAINSGSESNSYPGNGDTAPFFITSGLGSGSSTFTLDLSSNPSSFVDFCVYHINWGGGGGDNVEVRAITDTGTVLTNPTFSTPASPDYSISGNVVDATAYNANSNGLLGVYFQSPGSEKIERVEIVWSEATQSTNDMHGFGFGQIKFDGSPPAASLDYGDAPATFGDASAIVDSSIYLGASAPDSESGSQNNYRALADTIINTNGSVNPEEDGAPQSQYGVNLFPPLVETDTSYTTPIIVNNTSGGSATLESWIDFNRNGTFDAGEKTTVAVPNGTSGAVSLNWTSLPADMSYGTTFIRLRLTNDSTGAGEVEDHVIGIALAVPPESPSVSVMSGETVRACQVIVFQDDFDDLADGIYLSPNRAGSATIRDWTTTGGGEDTYARITTQSASDRVVYLGNGFVRRITPSITSLGGSLSFDANGRLTSVINGIELRSGPDDSSPGVTQNDSSWGPDEVVFSRTFPSVAGKVYRLYFTAVPESGSYSEGMMRIDTPVGSAHFRAPASGSGDINYAIEFTATSNSSTIAVANYGHIGGTSGDWCNPQHADPAGAPWCTQEGVTSGSGTNEVSVDDIYLVEAACDSDTSDTPADGSAAPAGGTTAYGTASHDIVSGIQLGAAIDADTASIASPNADGDGSDDDGVVNLPTLTPGDTGNINIAKADITASGTGTLHAWIDFNGDGVFGAAEYASSTINAGTVVSDLTFSGYGTTMAAGTTFARFRLTSDSNITSATPGGAASDGEVEDYAITVTVATATGPGTLIKSTDPDGDYVNDIAWLDWSGSSIDDDGFGGMENGDTVTFDLAGQCRTGTLTATFSNLSGHALVQTPNVRDMQTWSGAVAHEEYQTTGSGEAVHQVNSTGAHANIGYTIDFAMTVNGATVSPDLVVVDAESTGLGESWTITSSGGSWSLIENLVGTTYNISGLGSTAVTFSETEAMNGHGKSAPLLLSENTNQLVMSGITGGGQALAFGIVLPCDYGDVAPQDSAHPFEKSTNGVAGSIATPAPLVHTSGQPYLGTIPPDSELTTQADDGADEDGVTIPALAQGASTTITANISGAGSYLQAWIDWNGDGDFADTVDGISEQISINAQDNTTTVPGRTDDSDTTAGQISIAVSVPPSATTIQTFARFRWSTDLNLNATDAASDGEVEDYAITINASPTTPSTCTPVIPPGNPTAHLSSSDVTWNINGTFGSGPVMLDSVTVAGEPNTFSELIVPDTVSYQFAAQSASNQYIKDQGVNGANVTQGAAIFNPALLAANTDRDLSHYFSLDGSISSTDYVQFMYNTPVVSAGNRYVLISERFGNNAMSVEALDNLGQVIASSAPITPNVTNIDTGTAVDFGQHVYFTVYPLTAIAPSGTDIHGIRLTQSGASGSDGGDGKVFILVDPVTNCVDVYDHGDAPASYGGSQHTIKSDIYLGSTYPDAESTNQPSANADADDNTNAGDEDGVNITGVTLTQGQTTTVTASVTGAGGYLQAWIDWNGDGDFADTVDGISEQISIDAQDNTTTVPGRTDDADTTAGQISIAVSVPPSATTSQTFARFRWSTDLNLNATDAASDGEVEDYAITITAGSAGGPVGSCPYVMGFDGDAPVYDSTAYYALNNDVNGQHVSSMGTIASDASGAGKFLYHNTGVGNSIGEAWGTAAPATVQANTNYLLTFKMANVNGINPEIIQPQINGVNMGSVVSTSSVGTWETFSVIWNSGVATTADIALIQNRSLTSGIDWGFDDISLCSLDYSDAPANLSSIDADLTATYAEASHSLIDSSVYLGGIVDDDPGSQSTGLGADGDDSDGTDDDDGVTFPTLGASDVLMVGQSNTITVTASTAGFLNAWIDINQDGDWDDAGEQFATNQALSAGSNSVSLAPANTQPTGDTYLRFRFTSASVTTPLPTGALPDGEVEDYRVAIVLPEPGVCSSGLVDGGFENYSVSNTTGRLDGLGAGTYGIYQENVVPGWAFITSNPTDGVNFDQRNSVELWNSGYAGVPSYEGSA